MDDFTDIGPDAYESDQLVQGEQDAPPFDPYDDEAAAAYYVHNAGVEGTLANFVTYGAFDLLARAQGLFARNKVTEAVDTLRLISDMTEVNRDGVQYLSSLQGALGADVDEIASRAHMLLSGKYLDGSVEVDGSAMPVRTLLYDPEGARAIRSHRLKSELDLDPRFVDEYLSDDTAPEKRETLDRVLTKFLPYVSGADARRPGTVPAAMQSLQARDYAGAIMDMWDDKDSANGVVPGLGTVFGSGAAHLVGSLLSSNQNQAVGPGVLRALTTIYGRDERDGETGYARASRAVRDYLTLKNSVMKKSAYERTPLGVVVASDSGEGREELFSAVLENLAATEGGKLDLGSQYARDVFREVFDVYDSAKEKGLDLVRMFRASSVGPFARHAAKTIVDAMASKDPSGAVSASNTPIGTLKRMADVFDLRIMGSDAPKEFSELDAAGAPSARFRAAKAAADEQAPVCALAADDMKTALAESLLPEALSRGVDVVTLLRDEVEASRAAGKNTRALDSTVSAVEGRLRPYFTPETRDVLRDLATKLVTSFATNGRAVVSNVAIDYLSALDRELEVVSAVDEPDDETKVYADELSRKSKALASWVNDNVSRASALAPEITRLITMYQTVDGKPRKQAVAEAVAHANWSGAYDIQEAKAKLARMAETSTGYKEDGGKVVAVPGGAVVDELLSSPARLREHERLREKFTKDKAAADRLEQYKRKVQAGIDVANANNL